MFRYIHTNIIAKDCAKLIDFYKAVLGCKSIGEGRDLRGDWVDRLTGVPGAHIWGEHLCLPGYEADRPTLEIFQYNKEEVGDPPQINRCGIAHLAFEVDDVEETLDKVLAAGGGRIGEIVRVEYANGRKLVLVYATDIEGNIIELQSRYDYLTGS